MTIFLVVSCLCLTALDILTTHLGLASGHREMNPMAAAAFLIYGEFWVYAFKVVVTSLVIWVCLQLKSRNFALLMVDFLLLATVSNNFGRLL